jgi:hypothetical protein
VVGVVGRPAVEQVDDHVGLVVAVGVLEEQHPRLVDDQHPAVEELEPGRAVELVVEDRTFVRDPVPVPVFEDDELVIRLRVAGPPLRVARHARQPEPALVVEVQLHRLGDLREHRLIGEQLDLGPRGGGAGLDEFGRRLDGRPTLGVLAVLLPGFAEPGRRHDQLAGALVVRGRRHGLAGGDVPDVPIPDGGHLAELLVLARGTSRCHKSAGRRRRTSR